MADLLLEHGWVSVNREQIGYDVLAIQNAKESNLLPCFLSFIDR